MKRYNLCDYPWIPVITEIGQNELVTLKEVFEKADTVEVTGDSSVQRLAIWQFLEAIAGAVYKDEVIDLADDFDEEKLNAFKFDNRIQEYLDKWYESFWFVNDEGIPFMQYLTDEHKVSKVQPVKSMVLSIDEGENKSRMYTSVWRTLTPDQAIRAYLTYQAGSTKALLQNKEAYKSKYADGTKVPCGKIMGRLVDGLCVTVRGENLKETIMLNCALVMGSDEFDFGRPSWERLEDFQNSWYVPIENDYSLLWTYPIKCSRMVFDEAREQFTGVNTYISYFWYYEDNLWNDPTKVKHQNKNKDGYHYYHGYSKEHTDLYGCLVGLCTQQENGSQWNGVTWYTQNISDRELVFTEVTTKQECSVVHLLSQSYQSQVFSDPYLYSTVMTNKVQPVFDKIRGMVKMAWGNKSQYYRVSDKLTSDLVKVMATVDTIKDMKIEECLMKELDYFYDVSTKQILRSRKLMYQGKLLTEVEMFYKGGLKCLQ